MNRGGGGVRPYGRGALRPGRSQAKGTVLSPRTVPDPSLDASTKLGGLQIGLQIIPSEAEVVQGEGPEPSKVA
jgi:hypothetical protein